MIAKALPQELSNSNEFKALAKMQKNQKEAELWKQHLRKNKDEETIKKVSSYNVNLILENDSLLKDMFAFDEFSQTIHVVRDVTKLNVQKGELSDYVLNMVLDYIDNNSDYKVLFPENVMMIGITKQAHKHIYNPVKKRIESVEWDGKERAETYFIDYLGADDNEYNREVTKRWLVGAVSRAYHPGIKFELVPILYGKQGLGKSTAVSNIMPEYFSDSLATLGDNKDDLLALKGTWIQELGELSAMNHTKSEKVKQFISTVSDRYREPYGRLITTVPRTTAFIGTTNSNGFLMDETGNRRFYPIRVGDSKPKKDVFNASQDDLRQVLAEAKYLMDNNYPIFFNKSVEADKVLLLESERQQQQTMVEDPIRDAVLKYLSLTVPGTWDGYDDSRKRDWYQKYPDVQSFGFKSEYVQTLPHIAFVTVAEIMSVVFNKPARKMLSGGRPSSEAKKISLVITGTNEWEKGRNTNRDRGYTYTKTQ